MCSLPDLALESPSLRVRTLKERLKNLLNVTQLERIQAQGEWPQTCALNHTVPMGTEIPFQIHFQLRKKPLIFKLPQILIVSSGT